MRSLRSVSRLGKALGLAVAMIAATVVTVVPTAPQAWAAVGSTVVGRGSGRCLDVVGGDSTASGAKIALYDCHGGANQAWTLTAAGELRVYDGALCLDVSRQIRTSPAVLQTYRCNGGDNQHWKINADGTITGVQSGLCLDGYGRGTENGTPVQLYTCNGGSNQQWSTSVGSADRQPPTVPSSPRVSNLTCTSVTFAWNASSDNVGVAFYDVFHDGQLMKSVSGTTLSTSLTVVGGVTWGLFVNARDAAGNVSQASTTVPITPPQCQVDTTPPTAPTNLVGSAAGTTVTLSWTAATDNIGVRSYAVYRGAAVVGTVTGTSTVPPTTAFVDSGLAANTDYVYYVEARDGQGNASPASNTKSAKTGAACGSSVCTVKPIGTDTDVPWGLVTLPDGSILYGRRDAQDVVRLDPTTGAKKTVGKVPNVKGTDSEGGLMGLAISASFATDHWLYIMHTSPTDNRIVRIKVENDKLDIASEEILVSGILHNKNHNGGRLRFGPDDKLYASTGDAQNGSFAQNKAGLNGKVLRLNADGGVPRDNPFGNYVWSYGHRNPQGLAFDSQGRLWEQEFGNAVMDETNLIVKGGNYGWPSCEGTSGTCGTAGFIAAKVTYPTAVGSCAGIAIVRYVLYICCERGQRMYREVISGSSLTNVQAYFIGTYGRLRTVEPAPDGGLWLSTSTIGDKDSTPNNSDEKILHVTLGG